MAIFIIILIITVFSLLYEQDANLDIFQVFLLLYKQSPEISFLDAQS